MGSMSAATGVCMKQYMGTPDLNRYINYTSAAFSSGEIDDPANLDDDLVFMFSGSVDSTVDPLVMHTLEDYYSNYIKTGSITSEFDVAAEHCLPTLDFGEPCTVSKSPYIGKCNYDGAGLALNKLYGGSLASGTAVASHLTAFDQSPFVPATGSSLGSQGYIYVPAACEDGTTQCKLHISFHGCVQDLASIGNEYAADTGFNDWAEANNIIVLYPYAVTSVMPSNPNACWDWWGYTNADYVYQSGVQMKFVKDMIDHMTAGSPPTPSESPVVQPPTTATPTSAPVEAAPTFAPSESSYPCQEWTTCVWTHYDAGRAVFSDSYTHYLAKGSLDDLGLTLYCSGEAGNNSPVTVKMTADDYYELGSC
jgi:hypothetical protein